MTSQVISKAIDRVDSFIEDRNNKFPPEVVQILNDLSYIERHLLQNWHRVQHLKYIEDNVSRARQACGS